MDAENSSNTNSPANGTKCWLHSIQDGLVKQISLLHKRKSDFDAVVINIKEGVGKLNKMEPGDEMCRDLEGLAETAKIYISMLAAAAPFLMCDCNNSQDKAVARLYFGQRSELNQIVNDAYHAFWLRFRKTDDISDPSMEMELHHSDGDLESFSACTVLFKGLIYEITGVYPSH
ncbi:hypothetical protein AOL_s00088g50 [Orbilia oligospora ATCC 24927]|uniref:Fungal N-terminal domain-containing protein n=1 Tax=Arthrobotrys oligospora (strain ATCC 24927 / CBS 115.81 / DSM 1491) TaxID=756982 RepID=G1XHT7_ARTOA|nr:hypothetical protein AOL_s00088g50 [Orbilia oligospora ATCC 24927]EGX47335.1 hypothetical protein AOL_s00088g50 [Orbilia oligospora ATCC 24927]